MARATPWVRKNSVLVEAGLSEFVYIYHHLPVCLCSYEALESDEEKGSDNESDVSKLLIVYLVIIYVCEFSYVGNESDVSKYCVLSNNLWEVSVMAS
jgi:hypothetical protein